MLFMTSYLLFFVIHTPHQINRANCNATACATTYIQFQELNSFILFIKKCIIFLLRYAAAKVDRIEEKLKIKGAIKSRNYVVFFFRKN